MEYEGSGLSLCRHVGFTRFVSHPQDVKNELGPVNTHRLFSSSFLGFTLQGSKFKPQKGTT